MSFAFYRYPHEKEYTAVSQHGDAVQFGAYNELNGCSGFVFAPFRISERHPLLLIRPDRVERRKVPEDADITDYTTLCGASCSDGHAMTDAEGYQRYAEVFSRFHSRLTDGTFSKIVLSRCSDISFSGPLHAENLFMRACSLYPRMFIALVSTPQSGIWLMATPEILVERKDGRWHTVALAGTMRIGNNDTDDDLSLRRQEGDISEWSNKNIAEQRHVSSYIKECLGRFAVNVSMTRAYTARAGMVKHLKSDFMFDVCNGGDIGCLIDSLHPTPAVCGLPKREVYEFIAGNEGYDRAYYSGFAGPLSCCGETHLYVTLRCMSIDGNSARLYAGGGLMPESEVDNEWLETEAKMETMRRCLLTRKI